MTLVEILKSQGLSDESIQKVIGEMKQNKIYTSSEENIDIRYGKLKTDHDALVAKNTESQKLIESLQKNNKDNEAIQSKISEYKDLIAQKDEELKALKTDTAIKLALSNAKAVDVDYLMYKLKENGEIKLDENGNIKGIDDLLSGLKTKYPHQFESKKEEKKIDEKRLPNEGEPKPTMSKADIMSIKDASKRQKAIMENYELFTGKDSE